MLKPSSPLMQNCACSSVGLVNGVILVVSDPDIAPSGQNTAGIHLSKCLTPYKAQKCSLPLMWTKPLSLPSSLGLSFSLEAVQILLQLDSWQACLTGCPNRLRMFKPKLLTGIFPGPSTPLAEVLQPRCLSACLEQESSSCLLTRRDFWSGSLSSVSNLFQTPHPQ